MANKTISELQQKTVAEPSDVLIIENATTTNKITKQDLFNGYATLSDTHVHNNKVVLDEITLEMLNTWNEMADKIAALEDRVKNLEENGVTPPPPVTPEEPEPQPPVETGMDFANKIVFGYYIGWTNTVDPNNITMEELNESTTVYTNGNLQQTGKTSICPVTINNGFCPAGATFFVIVPATSNLNITKDNGIGGKVRFAEDILTDTIKTGCNGVSKTLNGVPVKVWGEFMSTETQLFFYAD